MAGSFIIPPERSRLRALSKIKQYGIFFDSRGEKSPPNVFNVGLFISLFPVCGAQVHDTTRNVFFGHFLVHGGKEITTFLLANPAALYEQKFSHDEQTSRAHCLVGGGTDAQAC